MRYSPLRQRPLAADGGALPGGPAALCGDVGSGGGSTEEPSGRAGSQVEVLSGPQSLADLAAHPDADTVVAAIVGAAGVRPTLAAVESGKRVLLANKETLVVTGSLFMDAVKRLGYAVPLDSEHNAIFSAFRQG